MGSPNPFSAGGKKKHLSFGTQFNQGNPKTVHSTNTLGLGHSLPIAPASNTYQHLIHLQAKCGCIYIYIYNTYMDFLGMAIQSHQQQNPLPPSEPFPSLPDFDWFQQCWGIPFGWPVKAKRGVQPILGCCRSPGAKITNCLPVKRKYEGKVQKVQVEKDPLPNSSKAPPSRLLSRLRARARAARGRRRRRRRRRRGLLRGAGPALRLLGAPGGGQRPEGPQGNRSQESGRRLSLLPCTRGTHFGVTLFLTHSHMGGFGGGGEPEGKKTNGWQPVVMLRYVCGKHQGFGDIKR